MAKPSEQLSVPAATFPGMTAPEDLAGHAGRRGGLHHVKLWVPDLRAAGEWGWLLGHLGYLAFQEWAAASGRRTSPTPIVRPLIEALVAQAGGYLHNTVRDCTTCQVCTAPVVGGWPMCFQCNEQRQSFDGALADNAACLFYGIDGEQSGIRCTDTRTERNCIRCNKVRVGGVLAGQRL